MRILLSFVLVLGGAGLHFYLLSLGIQRPYPIESYAPMAAGAALAAAAALRRGGWWRIGVVLIHLLFLAIFVRWTVSRTTRLLQGGFDAPPAIPEMNSPDPNRARVRFKSRAALRFSARVPQFPLGASPGGGGARTPGPRR